MHRIEWYDNRLGRANSDIKFEITPALQCKKVTMWFYGKCYKDTTDDDNVEDAKQLAELMLAGKLAEITQVINYE